MGRPVRTAIPFWADRSLSPRLAGPFAQMLEASEAVDSFWVWDQLTSWWPKVLWSPENTPAAAVSSDCDSFHDAFVIAGIAAAATERLGILIGGTDAIRNGPAELTQTMLSLASTAGGDSICLVAAGELKQIKPFGYRRSEGLARMEDVLRITRLLLTNDRPVDFDGNHWRLRDAWIGAVRDKIPEFWTLGGGPKLIELSGRYADGFTTAFPAVFPRAEQYADEVAGVRRVVDESGRDPDGFGFGLQVAAMIHDDPAVIEEAMTNPLIKWFAAVAGRFLQGKWLEEGIEPIWPPEFHYALKLLPASFTDEEALDVVRRVPEKMVRLAVAHGSAKEVADQIRPFIEAGANFVQIADLLPAALPAEEAPAAIARQIEVCRLLKQDR